MSVDLRNESAYIQAAPAYDVEAARRYIPLMPRIREQVSDLRDDGGLVSFGERRPSEEAMDRLEKEILRLSADRHKVSLIMEDLETRSGVAYRSALPMCAQSTVKAVYIGAVIDSRPDSVRESGRLMRDAIVLSDNDAYAALRRIYGREPIRQWCLETGVDPGFADPDYPRGNNARDMFRLWTRLYCFLNRDTTGFAAYYADSMASATRRQLSLPMQTKAGWEHGLGDERLFDPAEIPEKYRDGDPMNDETAANDTGIVYTPDGPYIFVIYTDHPYAAVEGCPHPLEYLPGRLYEVHKSIKRTPCRVRQDAGKI